MATSLPYENQDERNVPADQKDTDLHATAMRHAHEAWRAEQINISEGREDQRFAFGDQWPAADKQERDRERRPSIVVNRLPQFKRQVTGDIRKDTPGSKVLPSKDGTKKKAEIFTGMIRNIEQQSNAKAAYIQAVDNAIDVGMGVWRIDKEYENDNAFEQVIRIKRIMDPFGALCDPVAMEPVKSDARYWFIFDDMAEEEFKRQFPGKATDNFPSPPEGGMIWRMDKTIRVAEYWYKQEVVRTLELLEDGTTRYSDEDDAVETADQKEEEGEGDTPKEEAVEAADDRGGAGPAGAKAVAGPKVVQTRTVKTWKVMQCLMSGRDILEKPQEWDGRYIPIVPVIGEEARIDGRTLRKGMVRDAKGPQQVYNYMRTASAEYVGKQPSAPFVGTVKQFQGYEHVWQEAGSANHSYLPYNVDPQAPGPPQRSAPPSGATGLDQQAVIAASDMEAVIGIYRSNLGAPSNETSGRAILARQREGDTGSFFYVDNLRSSLAYSAKILIDLIPKVYDTARTVRTLAEDGSTFGMVPINQHLDPKMVPPGVEPEQLSKEVRETLNDLSIGEYDVIVSSGRGYASQRQEASEAMTNFIQAYPAAAPVIGDMIAKAQDWPDAEEVAERLKAINPLFQPPKGPDPKEAADALKSAAGADLTHAQATGQQIQNLSAGLQLEAQLQALGQILPALQQIVTQMGQVQQAPPQGQPGPPPGMPPMNGPMPPPTNGAAGPPQLSPSELGELEPLP